MRRTSTFHAMPCLISMAFLGLQPFEWIPCCLFERETSGHRSCLARFDGHHALAFDAQDYMESGTPGLKATERRLAEPALHALPQPADVATTQAAFRAIAMGPTLPRILSGSEPAVAVRPS